VNEGAALLLPDLQEEIEEAIKASTESDDWKNFVEINRTPPDVQHPSAGFPLAVKYVPSKRASDYLRANHGLYIGSDNFTWGKAVYVTGVDEPLSTAIYGRVGVVSWFNPSNWKVFDARKTATANQQLYLKWLRCQQNYDDAILTVHSNHYLHTLRNAFRAQFNIDAVLCSPDETDIHGWYTNPLDIWLGVSDWESPGVLAGGSEDTAKNYSGRFHDVRLTIVPEEEFTPDNPALTRSPQFALSNAAPNTPANVRQAYWQNTFVRVES
jgi:hypothetical protein